MSELVVVLRRAYRDSGLTLGQIATRAGVSERTVWAIMAGQNVRIVSLFSVCRALDVGTVPVPPPLTSTSCEILRADSSTI